MTAKLKCQSGETLLLPTSSATLTSVGTDQGEVTTQCDRAAKVIISCGAGVGQLGLL